MRLTADLFIALCCVMPLVSSKYAYPNKKPIQRTGAKKPILRTNVFDPDRVAFPQPLPTPPDRFIFSPYKSIYQGLRYENDTRVFRKRFEHDAMIAGQQVVCQGIFDCIISHIAIESTEAIPVLLRGGAGYRHFTAVIKAKPSRELKGQVRVYCRSNYEPAETDVGRSGAATKRRFYFGDKLQDENWDDDDNI
ncbi:uncharacterized protein LOC113495411 [Trichoplusia ni]|uniref:Uncharacterized protein LOC113495411 n=1 Tax=Trichoplusia ni TaxID=7111 RepID=A0A7E5VNQ2_TRINI|nr:uncharacterized protein LOC113495411 [Trichoplusia ni]